MNNIIKILINSTKFPLLEEMGEKEGEEERREGTKISENASNLGKRERERRREEIFFQIAQ